MIPLEIESHAGGKWFPAFARQPSMTSSMGTAGRRRTAGLAS